MDHNILKILQHTLETNIRESREFESTKKNDRADIFGRWCKRVKRMPWDAQKNLQIQRHSKKLEKPKMYDFKTQKSTKFPNHNNRGSRGQSVDGGGCPEGGDGFRVVEVGDVPVVAGAGPPLGFSYLHSNQSGG